MRLAFLSAASKLSSHLQTGCAVQGCPYLGNRPGKFHNECVSLSQAGLLLHNHAFDS